jgi:hypothetical protein
MTLQQNVDQLAPLQLPRKFLAANGAAIEEHLPPKQFNIVKVDEASERELLRAMAGQ